MRVNLFLYKLHFLSSHFSSQPNKIVFHPFTLPSFKPNTYEEKLNLFHPHNQTKPYSSYILFQTLKEFINVAETEVESVTNLYSVVVS